jgi:hypothetical protein
MSSLDRILFKEVEKSLPDHVLVGGERDEDLGVLWRKH